MSKDFWKQFSIDFRCEVVIDSLIMSDACGFRLNTPTEYVSDIQLALLMGVEISQ